MIYAGGDAMACVLEIENPTLFGLAAGATNCAAATSRPQVGYIYELAGTGSPGASGDGGIAAAAVMTYVAAVAISADGDVYLTDNSTQSTRTSRIRVVYAGGATAAKLIQLENPGTTPVVGYIYKIAGGVFASSGDGGLASASGLLYSRGLVLDADSNIIFTDYSTTAGSLTGKVRVVYAGGTRMAALIALENPGTVAQVGYIYLLGGSASTGNTGDGGLATAATMTTPYDLAVDAAGDIYIADYTAYVVRRISAATGVITTAIGNGAHMLVNANAFTSSLWDPYGIALGSSGTIFFSDPGIYRLRNVSLAAADLTFANVTSVGSVSAAQVLVHSNIGTTPLLISGVTATTNFAVVPSGSTVYSNCVAGLILAAGQSCAVGVALAPVPPVGTGTVTGTLTVLDNSLNGVAVAHTAALSGSVTGEVTTTTAVTTSLTPADSGKPVTFTATITPDPTAVLTGLVLDGTVSFYDGTTLLASVNLANGTASYTTSALTSGTHTIKALYNGNTSFYTSSGTVSQVVIAPSYAISPSSSGVAVTVAQSVAVPFQVSTAGGYLGKMTASCLGPLPQGIACNFSPSSVSFTGGNNAQTVTLTISAFTASLSAPKPLSTGTRGGVLAYACLFGVPGLLFGLRRFRRQRPVFLSLFMLACTGSLLAISGCGSGSTAQLPNTGTYSVTVSFTDGTSTTAVPVTVSVTGKGWQQ